MKCATDLNDFLYFIYSILKKSLKISPKNYNRCLAENLLTKISCMLPSLALLSILHSGLLSDVRVDRAKTSRFKLLASDN